MQLITTSRSISQEKEEEEDFEEEGLETSDGLEIINEDEFEDREEENE